MASAAQPISGPPPPLRAALVARVSSVEQDAEGKTSIAEQVARCRAEIERRGWTLDDRHIFVDRVSGKLTSRFERPLAAARAAEFDALVFTKVDRLARSLRDMLNVEAELSELGVVLVATDLPLDTTTPTGRLMFHQLGAFAEYEAANIVQRMTEHNRAKVRNGGWPGGELPWGLVLVDGQVQLHDAEVAVIHEAWRLVVVEGLSCWQASDRLNEAGLLPRHAAEWNNRLLRGRLQMLHSQGRDALVPPTVLGPGSPTGPGRAQQDGHGSLWTGDTRDHPGRDGGGGVVPAPGGPSPDLDLPAGP